MEERERLIDCESIQYLVAIKSVWWPGSMKGGTRRMWQKTDEIPDDQCMLPLQPLYLHHPIAARSQDFVPASTPPFGDTASFREFAESQRKLLGSAGHHLYTVSDLQVTPEIGIDVFSGPLRSARIISGSHRSGRLLHQDLYGRTRETLTMSTTRTASPCSVQVSSRLSRDLSWHDCFM